MRSPNVFYTNIFNGTLNINRINANVNNGFVTNFTALLAILLNFLIITTHYFNSLLQINKKFEYVQTPSFPIFSSVDVPFVIFRVVFPD